MVKQLFKISFENENPVIIYDNNHLTIDNKGYTIRFDTTSNTIKAIADNSKEAISLTTVSEIKELLGTSNNLLLINENDDTIFLFDIIKDVIIIPQHNNNSTSIPQTKTNSIEFPSPSFENTNDSDSKKIPTSFNKGFPKKDKPIVVNTPIDVDKMLTKPTKQNTTQVMSLKNIKSMYDTNTNLLVLFAPIDSRYDNEDLTNLYNSNSCFTKVKEYVDSIKTKFYYDKLGTVTTFDSINLIYCYRDNQFDIAAFLVGLRILMYGLPRYFKDDVTLLFPKLENDDNEYYQKALIHELSTMSISNPIIFYTNK